VVVLWLLLSRAAEAAEAGYLARVLGEVSIDERRAATGESFETRSIIATGPRAFSLLKFADGAVLALKSNTALVVQEYVYDKEKPAESRSSMALLKGGLRALTGAIGANQPKRVSFQTPVATIGIRGTDFIVAVSRREAAAVETASAAAGLQRGGAASADHVLAKAPEAVLAQAPEAPNVSGPQAFEDCLYFLLSRTTLFTKTLDGQTKVSYFKVKEKVVDEETKRQRLHEVQCQNLPDDVIYQVTRYVTGLLEAGETIDVDESVSLVRVEQDVSQEEEFAFVAGDQVTGSELDAARQESGTEFLSSDEMTDAIQDVSNLGEGEVADSTALETALIAALESEETALELTSVVSDSDVAADTTETGPDGTRLDFADSDLDFTSVASDADGAADTTDTGPDGTSPVSAVVRDDGY
jgi:hypothetical protein